jgi:hypothetical protein
MTLSSNLAGLMINAASSAPARKLIFVSIDIFYVRSQAAAQTESMRLESAERVFNIPADESSDGTAKVVSDSFC